MKASQVIMGLPITIDLVDDNPAALETVWAELRRIDAMYSPYLPGSLVSQLNRGELQRDGLPEEAREVLAACEAWHERSAGAFNSLRPDGRLDPSGYVKGWSVYRAARLLDDGYVTRYCVNAGGDIQLRGQAPGGGPWRISLVHPFEPGRAAKLLHLQDCAVATSGTYERGRHIYDPRTGAPVMDPVSLTVIGARIDEVDALATAAFVMGETGLAFVQAQGCEAMMIRADGGVILTPGFRRYELNTHSTAN